MKSLIHIGIIIILIGFILIFIGSITNKENSKIKTAGGFFIGPFPIFGFGESKIFYILWGLAIAIFIFYIIFFKFL